jgi:hypothetical protein
MSFFSTTTFKKPTKPRVARTPLKKVAKKGDFWIFVSKVLSKFFLRIELPRRCEACDGSAYCGPIQPAHSRRRQDIRVGDWYYAFRVAVLGNDCHFAIDRKGRRAAEPLIEAIIIDRFADMNLSEDQVKELLLECAAEVQTEHREFEQYLVTL